MNKTTKKVSLILCITMVLLVCFSLANVQTSGVWGYGLKLIDNEANLRDAIENYEPGEILVVQSDFEVEEVITIPAGNNIILVGDDVSPGLILKITRGQQFPTGPMFIVDEGATFSIEWIIFDGGYTGTESTESTGPIIENNGTLIMDNRSALVNNKDKSAASHGGAVMNNGTFTMNSGSQITGCINGYGGGGVYNQGTFTMNGGEISGNRGDGGGVQNNGTFVMSGGGITGNLGYNGTESEAGSGINNSNGKFYIKGSSQISSNNISFSDGNPIKITGAMTGPVEVSLQPGLADGTTVCIGDGYDLTQTDVDAFAASGYILLLEYNKIVTLAPTIKIDKTVTLAKGETKRLDASVKPDDVADNLIWSSSDPDVVTVDSSGLIKGIASGSAVVTVSNSDYDIKASSDIKVSDNETTDPVDPAGAVKDKNTPVSGNSTDTGDHMPWVNFLAVMAICALVIFSVNIIKRRRI